MKKVRPVRQDKTNLKDPEADARDPQVERSEILTDSDRTKTTRQQ